jgi:hypothetical protein
MPYYKIIKAKAKHVANRGSPADTLYNMVLNTWFPSSKGYLTGCYVLGGAGKPDRKHLFVRPVGGRHDLLLVVEHKHQAKWNDAGKQEVMEDLTEYMEAQVNKTKYNAIYGLAGIGLHWMVCKMEKDGLPIPTTVLDWHDDISSDLSYDAFETVAALVYNIH